MDSNKAYWNKDYKRWRRLTRLQTKNLKSLGWNNPLAEILKMRKPWRVPLTVVYSVNQIDDVAYSQWLGSFSIDDGHAEDDTVQKSIYISLSNVADCVELFSTPNGLKTCLELNT